METREIMKKKVIIVLCAAAAVIAVALFIWLYQCHSFSEKDSFSDRIYINGTDCSMLLKSDAKELLTDNLNSDDFSIVRNGVTIGTIPSENLTYDIEDALDSILKDAGFFTWLGYVFGGSISSEVPMIIDDAPDDFKAEIRAFVKKYNAGRTKSRNAYVDMSTTEFNVVPEVYGNTISRKLLTADITEHISAGEMSLDFNAEAYRTSPKVTSDSQEISDMLDYCSRYLSANIKYSFGDQVVSVSPAEMNRMIYPDDNGNVTVDEDKVSSFVKKLAKEYNTYGSIRTFDSTKRGPVNVYGGNYGYIIDQQKEVKELIKDLKKGQDVLREPCYSRKGNGRNGKNDITGTYIEVDLSLQQLWYYKDGKLIVECPIVSGCLKEKMGTIIGTYSLAYKERDATLRGGDEEEGTDYESKVSYWMPFCNGYGLHDATWRNVFGGNIYVSNGSHGCINMPYYSAQTLFENVQAGCSIVIFY